MDERSCLPTFFLKQLDQQGYAFRLVYSTFSLWLLRQPKRDWHAPPLPRRIVLARASERFDLLLKMPRKFFDPFIYVLIWDTYCHDRWCLGTYLNQRMLAHNDFRNFDYSTRPLTFRAREIIIRNQYPAAFTAARCGRPNKLLFVKDFLIAR